MLLRSRRYFNLDDILTQYKQLISSYIEYRAPAIYHATTSVWSQLDRTYDAFLREIRISREFALLEFNLAPLGMRRDIAMLRLIHRAAIGKGPPHFRRMFKRRAGSLRIADFCEECDVSLLALRSVWGLVGVYNLLGGMATCAIVKDFQVALQGWARRIIQKDLVEQWGTLYSPRCKS